MTDRRNKNGDYEVGYGKPPKHSQFPPGVSGNKGRRKKLPEAHAEIIARVRDEVVVGPNGKPITMFELAIRQVYNQTIKRGKPADLQKLLELLNKYGAIPQVDRAAEAKAGAEEAVRKIFTAFDRTFDIDPADCEACNKEAKAEVELVMGCTHCGPELRKRWGRPEFRALVERYGGTALFGQVQKLREGRCF